MTHYNVAVEEVGIKVQMSCQYLDFRWLYSEPTYPVNILTFQKTDSNINWLVVSVRINQQEKCFWQEM